MKRLVSALLVALFIVIQPWIEKQIAPWSGAHAISDYGHLAITRLWVSTREGRTFGCTGFYIDKSAGASARTYVVTAGHCTRADAAMRDTAGFVLYPVQWRGVIFGHADIHKRLDVAFGTSVLPDDIPISGRLRLADESPKDGFVWIHGFPLGVERVTAGELRSPDPLFPGSLVIELRDAKDVEPGSSGSPVLNAYGQVVGIVWGMLTEYDRATGEVVPSGRILVTPVEALHALMALLELPPK